MANPKDLYFLGICKAVAKGSTCTRRKVGAVIVKENIVISTGYNGTPRKWPNCDEGGCPRSIHAKQDSGCGLEIDSLCCHAEENAIIQASFAGSRVEGGTLYCLLQPCHLCAKMIINAGIKEVVYSESYDNELGLQLLQKTKHMEVRKVSC